MTTSEEKIRTIAKEAKELKNDSIISCGERFLENSKRLFAYICEVNSYLGSIDPDGKYPVPPFVLNLASSYVTNVSVDNSLTLSSIFLERSSVVFDEIKSRDPSRFKSLAGSLFKEIPLNIVENISEFVCSEKLPKETKDTVFDYIDAMLRITIKRESLYRFYFNQEIESNPNLPPNGPSADISFDTLANGVDLFFSK